MHTPKVIKLYTLKRQLIICQSYLKEAERKREAAGQDHQALGENNEEKRTTERLLEPG